MGWGVRVLGETIVREVGLQRTRTTAAADSLNDVLSAELLGVPVQIQSIQKFQNHSNLIMHPYAHFSVAGIHTFRIALKGRF